MKKYEAVALKDGRKGTIVVVLADGEAFIVDVDVVGTDGTVSWETVEVTKNEILC